MRVSFAGVEVALPAGWCDITDDLPDGTPPTLAREDGVGAIQFSVAFYKAGERPDFDESALHEMLTARFASLTERRVVETEQSAPCLVVGVEGLMEMERLGAWYVSDGTNLAFVTYLGEAALPASGPELSEARAVVHSLRFPTTG